MKKFIKYKAVGKYALAILLVAVSISSWAQNQDLPKITKINGRNTFLVDGKPFLMLGGQAHNSSAWPRIMPQVWKAVDKLHANTLEVPIYWENIEPEQGKFDFSVIDTLLTQARQHKKRLVLLWFATWKNGSNHYMPEWMKRDAEKYPNIKGKNGQLIDSPSPHAEATLEADIKAFKAVMAHLKAADPQHTVIMVQVENEPGSWDTVRDFSPLAQKLFGQQVPAALLKPEILKELNHNKILKGTWQQVFGEDADEYFHAWSVARFIGLVAAAGKAIYPLPMYANAALRDPLTKPRPPSYESGGPTDNVIAIWKAAAPALDLVAPDIYLSGSEKILKVIELYDRPDNALFVPEAGLQVEKAKYLYPVLAHGGIGYSPFGIDANNEPKTDEELAASLSPFSQDYEVLAGMAGEIAQWINQDKVKAVVEHEDHAEQPLDLGLWQAKVTFGNIDRNMIKPNEIPTGRLMVVQLKENQFILIGSLCNITFKPLKANLGKAWQYLKVEEGYYQNGKFESLRILNGDETDWGGPRFDKRTTLLKVELVAR
jgi:beta-galactosidase GanA